MANLFSDTSGATITTMIPSFYDRVFLERLMSNLTYDKYGVQKPLPQKEGSSIIWHQLTNPGAGYTLDETGVPGTSAVSTRKVSATIVWKADLRNVTTRVEATAVCPVVKEVVEALGYGAALTKDNYISDQVGFGSAASTGVADAASVALPSAYTQGFPLFEGNRASAFWATVALHNGLFSTQGTIAHIRNAVTHLRGLDAMPFDDGEYRGVIHPTVSKHIRSDSNFATWMAYTNRSAMEKGKLGTIEGVMFEESSQAMKVAVLSSTWSGFVSGGTLYGTLIVGRGAYGVSKLRGQDAKVNIVSGPDKSDPLNQHTYIGYKFGMAAKPLNPSAGVILTWLEP